MRRERVEKGWGEGGGEEEKGQEEESRSFDEGRTEKN